MTRQPGPSRVYSAPLFSGRLRLRRSLRQALREQVNEAPNHEQDAEQDRNQQDRGRKSFHVPNGYTVHSGLGHANIAGPWCSWPSSDLRITRVSRCVARGFKARASSSSPVSADAGRWLLMAVRGHLAGTHPQCVGQVPGGAAPSNDRPFSGRTYPQLARIVRLLCVIAGRRWQRLAAAAAVTVAVNRDPGDLAARERLRHARHGPWILVVVQLPEGTEDVYPNRDP